MIILYRPRVKARGPNMAGGLGLGFTACIDHKLHLSQCIYIMLRQSDDIPPLESSVYTSVFNAKTKKGPLQSVGGIPVLVPALWAGCL